MMAVAGAAADDRFREGMAILGGPDADRDAQRAGSLIIEAAAEGHAEALERRAMFECRGGRDSDWAKSLDTLVEAAERGSSAARSQLLILADHPDTEANLPAWADVRSRIPISDRLAGRKAALLSPDPAISTVTAMAGEAECRWLRTVAEPGLQRAMLYTDPPRADPGRTNHSLWLKFDRLDVVGEMIRTRIANTLGVALPCLEISQVLRYQVGQEFALHCDFLNPQTRGQDIARSGQRATTFLIYLNEDFEGGETSFPLLGIRHRAATGDALIFRNVDSTGQPDTRTQHAGLPPKKGQKWVFSQWVRDRVPAPAP